MDTETESIFSSFGRERENWELLKFLNAYESADLHIRQEIRNFVQKPVHSRVLLAPEDFSGVVFTLAYFQILSLLYSVNQLISTNVE
jgi:hypothetical protein